MRTGLHINSWRNPAQTIDYYRRSGARVAKALEFDRGGLAALKAAGVTIIGRVYREHQSLSEAEARHFNATVVDHARAYPEVDYWEGWNEAFQGRQELARYAEVEIERMRALEAVGKRAVIGNFSQGQPGLTDWHLFRPALEHAMRRGHALGLHEYAGPYMMYEVETPDGRNRTHKGAFTGTSMQSYRIPGLEGWKTLRYRKAYGVFRGWGLGELPLFITESGIDDTPPAPGPPGRGWRDRQGFGGGQFVGDYADQRAWYSWQLSHDRYVRGVVDFAWQTSDPRWSSFDLSADQGMVDRLIAAESDLPVWHFSAAARPPAKVPEPEPESPVHGRHYVAHVVQPGETLWSLAGSRWRELLRTVPMGEPRSLPAGTVVLIPEELKQ